MNIDRNHVGQEIETISSHLESLYQTVPRWREILAAVKAGHLEFIDLLASSGLLDAFGHSTSTVHPYDEIEVHAFILAIVSDDRWPEIQAKSFLTYASHWIDDFFDNPEQVQNPAQLLADRCEIRRALANMGRVGEVGFAMAARVPHPDGVYQALHRMLYGGLVQRSRDCDERLRLVAEYVTVATSKLEPDLAKSIRTLQPQAYWTTNKTVLELLSAAEQDLDFNSVEPWSMIYAPALYYQDADEERARGELNFDESEAPRLSEMIKMIRLGSSYIARAYRETSLYMRQLKFAALSIPNLPEPIADEYRMLWEGVR